MKKKTWKEGWKNTYKELFDFEPKGYFIPLLGLFFISLILCYGLEIIKDIEIGFQTFIWFTCVAVLITIGCLLIKQLEGYLKIGGMIMLMLVLTQRIGFIMNTFLALLILHIIFLIIKTIKKEKKRKGCKPISHKRKK